MSQVGLGKGGGGRYDTFLISNSVMASKASLSLSLFALPPLTPVRKWRWFFPRDCHANPPFPAAVSIRHKLRPGLVNTALKSIQ